MNYHVPAAIVLPAPLVVTVQTADGPFTLSGIDAVLKYAKGREEAYANSQRSALDRAMELGRVLLPVRRHLASDQRYGAVLAAHGINQKRALRAVRIAEAAEAGNAAVLEAKSLHQAEKAAGVRRDGPIGPTETGGDADGPIGPSAVTRGTFIVDRGELIEPTADEQLDEIRERLAAMDDEELADHLDAGIDDEAVVAALGYSLRDDGTVVRPGGATPLPSPSLGIPPAGSGGNGERGEQEVGDGQRGGDEPGAAGVDRDGVGLRGWGGVADRGDGVRAVDLVVPTPGGSAVYRASVGGEQPAAGAVENGADERGSGQGGSAHQGASPVAGVAVARAAGDAAGSTAVSTLTPGPSPAFTGEGGRKAVQLTLGELYEAAGRVRRVADRLQGGELAADVVARLMAAVDAAEGRAA